MNQIPAIGRIVHATILNANKRLVVRPAIIVEVWGEEPKGAVNAQVFCDGDGGKYNDGLPNVLWVTSLTFTEEPGQRQMTWSWPPKLSPESCLPTPLAPHRMKSTILAHLASGPDQFGRSVYGITLVVMNARPGHPVTVADREPVKAALRELVAEGSVVEIGIRHHRYYTAAQWADRQAERKARAAKPTALAA